LKREQKTILERIEALSLTQISAGLIILIILPLIVPLNIMPPITPEVRGYYNSIENLPAGSRIFIHHRGAAAYYYPDLQGSSEATLYHIFRNKLRVVIACFAPDMPLVAADALERVLGGPPGQEKNFNVTYGVDYVLFGFVGYGEAATRAYATDVKGTMEKDYFGNSVSDLPIMWEPTPLETATDFDVLVIADSWDAHSVARQLLGWETPVIAMMTGGITGEALPYVAAGMWKGYLGSIRGGSEYENLLDIKGEAALYNDTITTGHLYLLALLIVGNVAFYLKKKGVSD